MKKLIAVLAVAVMALASTFAEEGDGMRAVSKELSFDVPSGWSVCYDSSEDADYLFVVDGPSYEGVDYSGSVTIERKPIEKGVKFTETGYLKTLLAQIEESHEDSYEYLAGDRQYAAVRYVHTDLGEDGLDVIQFIKIVIKKNVVYIVCATEPPEWFNLYEDGFNKIVMSCK